MLKSFTKNMYQINMDNQIIGQTIDQLTNQPCKYVMPYTNDFLIERLLENLDNDILNTKKASFAKLTISRKNRKTLIENFGNVCKSLGREIEEIREYFEKSLALGSADITVSAAGVLIITGSHTDINLKKHYKDYIINYVMCSEKGCGSSSTKLTKENRILWITCKKCNHKKAVQMIK